MKMKNMTKKQLIENIEKDKMYLREKNKVIEQINHDSDVNWQIMKAKNRGTNVV